MRKSIEPIERETSDRFDYSHLPVLQAKKSMTRGQRLLEVRMRASIELTFESRFFSLFRKSMSSVEVIRMMLSLAE